MGNFDVDGFPATRWALTDPGSDLTECFQSLDKAIRFALFNAAASVDMNGWTKPIYLQDGLCNIPNEFQIGSGETIDDIVDAIPDTPGVTEDTELATVEAIRAFVAEETSGIGTDLIPLITSPVAGGVPLMAADGSLVTSAWVPADWVAVAGDIMTGDLTMTGVDIHLTGGGQVIPDSLIGSTYHFLDRYGLGATDDTGATEALLHLGVLNADVGTPYYKDPSDNHYELYHEGNLTPSNYMAIADSGFGSIQASVGTPSAAGTAPTTQTIDTQDSVQGVDVWTITGGNIQVDAAGTYVVQINVASPGVIQVGVQIVAGGTTIEHVKTVTSGIASNAALTGIFLLSSSDTITAKVFHPGGSVTPLSVIVTAARVGPIEVS